jgi:hypothetical protein
MAINELNPTSKSNKITLTTLHGTGLRQMLLPRPDMKLANEFWRVDWRGAMNIQTVT